MNYDLNLTETHRVMADYFGTTLPNDFLRQVIESDLDLFEEVRHGSIGDTYAREILIHYVTQELAVPEWPRNCDSDEYTKDFCRRYAEAIRKVGGEFWRDDL